MKHANLSIFVPHLGCPNQCSFCDQRSISGAPDAPDAAAVTALCAESAARLTERGGEAEIAFFGGSFTAIDRTYMIELLEAAYPFTEGGSFKGIRISTRPDCIDEEILTLLRRYHVTAIELGAQSMSDTVLTANGRGHTAADVEKASALIRAGGFELGLQMMTGLYASDEAADLDTAHRLAELQPDTVRVYPTLVMEGTRLAALCRVGEYRPQTLEQAVSLGARLLELFEKRDITVIRMGLHAAPSLEAGLLAGPYHPAFRELCEGELLRRRALALLEGKPKGNYLLRVAQKSISKITGHGGRTVDDLKKLGYTIKIKQDADLTGFHLTLEEV